MNRVAIPPQEIEFSTGTPVMDSDTVGFVFDIETGSQPKEVLDSLYDEPAEDKIESLVKSCVTNGGFSIGEARFKKLVSSLPEGETESPGCRARHSRARSV